MTAGTQADEMVDGVGGHRPREVEALAGVRAERAELLVLLEGLDALGDDAHAQAVREFDDSPDDDLTRTVRLEIRDERAVDLHDVSGN